MHSHLLLSGNFSNSIIFTNALKYLDQISRFSKDAKRKERKRKGKVKVSGKVNHTQRKSKWKSKSKDKFLRNSGKNS